MALVRRKLVAFNGGDFIAGYEYENTTGAITRLGGVNNGTGTGNVQVEYIPTGATRSREFLPQSGLFLFDVSSLGWVIASEDWEHDHPQFNTIASYG